ncbi:MAG: DUF2271 domain-containing protein [Bacteroidales bacterium]|nr:DUF2271 domain-containing protein [Bacteroidales bacterium]
MNRLITIIAVLILFVVSSSDSPDLYKVYSFNYENVLGTSFMLKVSATSENEAEEAGQTALEEIDRLASILSTYDPESEFRHWQNTYNVDVPVSPELFEVLALFDQWREKTGGALNPAAAVAIDLWSQAAQKNSLPEKEKLEQAVAEMSKDHWELDYENHSARHLSTEPLVLNTFVKSFIISKASEALMDVPGIRSALINIGGDIVTAGPSEEVIKITDPLAPTENDNPAATIRIDNKAIATSGNYRRGFQIGNEWYSHIIDARTAIPSQEVISATVVADNATDAGALATAFNILSPEESVELAREMEDIEYLILTRSGRRIESDGWDKYEIQDKSVKIADRGNSMSKAENTDSEFELLIDIELARFEGRYLRPYVAVWVEDENGESIRTLALWFNNYRWLPDLRRWYAKNLSRIQNNDFMQSVTSATRPAGKYSFKWDGKDDQGNQRNPGKYSVCIEVVREHGTYQLIRKQVELNGESQRFELPPGTEVSSAVIEYRKVEKMNASL